MPKEKLKTPPNPKFWTPRMLPESPLLPLASSAMYIRTFMSRPENPRKCRKSTELQRAPNPPEFAQPSLSRAKQHRSKTPKFVASCSGLEQIWSNEEIPEIQRKPTKQWPKIPEIPRTPYGAITNNPRDSEEISEAITENREVLHGVRADGVGVEFPFLQ